MHTDRFKIQRNWSQFLPTDSQIWGKSYLEQEPRTWGPVEGHKTALIITTCPCIIRSSIALKVIPKCLSKWGSYCTKCKSMMKNSNQELIGSFPAWVWRLAWRVKILGTGVWVSELSEYMLHSVSCIQFVQFLNDCRRHEARLGIFRMINSAPVHTWKIPEIHWHVFIWTFFNSNLPFHWARNGLQARIHS